MPYKPIESTFLDTTHAAILYYAETVEEPISPATSTNGATVQLYDTPLVSGETYRAPRIAGVAGIGRVEIKIGAGAWTDASSGVAVGGTVGVEQSVQMRLVALPYSGTGDNPQAWYALHVCSTGEADWLA